MRMETEALQNFSGISMQPLEKRGNNQTVQEPSVPNATGTVLGSSGSSTGSGPAMTGQGAQFVYAATTIANILTSNLTAAQINLLANFLSVITACVYAILAVENPSDISES